ncbi:MAG: APC family permease, partial [Deltaproteobacteria bacterium]|nr:APC family permease [Deltaproteobacteria bacterium]
RREIKLRTIVSTGAGMALATVNYIAFIELASYMAGNSAWIAILTSGIMAVLAGCCFSELNSMYPTAAGIKLYVERAFSERVAIIIAGAYVMGQLSIVGAEVYILSQAISQGITFVHPAVWAALFGAALLALNIRGIRIAGNVQDVIAYTMFISLGIACFIAFEWVVTISEEVTDVKMVPKGMMISLGVLAIVYALFSTAMTSVLGKEQLAWVLTPEGLPIPHLLYGKKLLGDFGLYFMIVMALLASLTSLNAGIMTSSRFIYAMARDWSLPKFIARLHPKYATPWVAMLIVMAYSVCVTVYGFLTHYVLSMILVIAATECMIYMVMAVCVIRLRKKQPDTERSFKIKGGITIPIIVIVVYGIVGGFILFGPVKPQDVTDQRIAKGFIAGLIAFNCIYVFGIWPRLRAKYQKIAEARKPRRRRRQPPANEQA